ncbi:MAG: histidine phosphatase family protein, partial [Sulfuritalea sp.]|nr:histidine phosphatase family protein [Sulfuritalea sp.]
MSSNHGPAYICVARHGETDWNVSGILQGWLDVPLNDRGRRQAYELVAGFAHARFAKLYSSSLVRSSETAEIVARSLRLPPPEFDDGLRERNFGAIQGIPKAELAELNPVLLQQILKRNPATDFEQGETMDEFADRVLDAIARIARPNAGKRVLAITHGWTIDVITR